MRPGIISATLITLAVIFWLILTGLTTWESVMVHIYGSGAELQMAGSLGFRLALAGFFLCLTLSLHRFFSKIEKLNVTTMIWRLFITGMIGIGIIVGVALVNRSTTTMTIHPYLQPAYFFLSLLAVSVFFLVATFVFRRFVLYPRTKQKVLGWNFFLGFLGLGLVLLLFNLDIGFMIWGGSLVFFLPLSLILAANVKWVAYLNFGQKLRALGLLVLVLVVIVTYFAIIQRLPERIGFSILDDTNLAFLTYPIIFPTVYVLASILVLFFNLPTSSIFERESFEIASYNKINQAIQSNLDFSEIMNTLLEASMLTSNAQAGWLEMRTDEKEPITVRLRKKISAEEIKQLKRNSGMTQKVLEDNIHLLVRDTRKNRLLKENPTRFRCLVVIPIKSNTQAYGAIYLANNLVNSFEDVTISSVSAFAEQAAMALENAKLVKESIETERYREQIKIAKEVQNELLPSALPNDDKISFAAVSETAYEVGGDYFDVMAFAENKYKVAIGDVSGKGTTAAFYMAEVKGIFHALGSLDLSVEAFITTANKALSECFQKGFFVTLTYLQIDTQERRIEMLRAGHCPAFFYDADKKQVRKLTKGMPGLAIIRNSGFSRHVTGRESFEYQPGDFLVLYTDGIIEARNAEREQFGYERLQEIICRFRNDSPTEIASQIEIAVKEFAQTQPEDDYTLLIIKLN